MTVNSLDLVQGSDEWVRARIGSLGASRVHEAVTKTKSGYGASRANLMAELIAERLTQTPAERFVNAAMQHGTDTEPQARDAYSFYAEVEVVQVGLIQHPYINGSHASPDGYVGDDGLLEIKCPSTSVHIETLLGGSVPSKYITQVQWQMACTGRLWCDFVSYDPRLPEEMRIFIQRVKRDGAHITALELEVMTFLSEVDEKIAALTQRYARAA